MQQGSAGSGGCVESLYYVRAYVIGLAGGRQCGAGLVRRALYVVKVIVCGWRLRRRRRVSFENVCRPAMLSHRRLLLYGMVIGYPCDGLRLRSDKSIVIRTSDL